MLKLNHSPNLEVIDPGANLGWWAQHELQAQAKSDPDDGDDDGDDDDDDDDDDPDDGKTPEELAAELKAVRKSLEKANGASAKRRGKLRERERELDELRKGKSKDKSGDKDDDAVDADAIRETALAEGRAIGDDKLKFAEVKTALASAGVTDKKTLVRLARMVDLKDLDLDDDGEVDGLDDVIDELKSDMPALFGATRKRRSVAGDADDGKESKGGKGKSASERQGAALMGKTG